MSAIRTALAGAIVAVALTAGQAVAMSPQGYMDATTTWLGTTLHAEVQSRTVTVSDDLAQATWDGEFSMPYGSVMLRPWVAGSLVHRDVTLDLGEPTMPGYRRYYGGAYVLLHEALHRAATYACWGVGLGGVDVEEGAVDALTLDLYPAWVARFYGRRAARGLWAEPSYPRAVRMVRAWSARATGSRTWRTRDARLWRRALWGASCDGRAAMIGEAAR